MQQLPAAEKIPSLRWIWSGCEQKPRLGALEIATGKQQRPARRSPSSAGGAFDGEGLLGSQNGVLG
jgi:hypothetical protein